MQRLPYLSMFEWNTLCCLLLTWSFWFKDAQLAPVNDLCHFVARYNILLPCWPYSVIDKGGAGRPVTQRASNLPASRVWIPFKYKTLGIRGQIDRVRQHNHPSMERHDGFLIPWKMIAKIQITITHILPQDSWKIPQGNCKRQQNRANSGEDRSPCPSPASEHW